MLESCLIPCSAVIRFLILEVQFCVMVLPILNQRFPLASSISYLNTHSFGLAKYLHIKYNHQSFKTKISQHRQYRDFFLKVRVRYFTAKQYVTSSLRERESVNIIFGELCVAPDLNITYNVFFYLGR